MTTTEHASFPTQLTKADRPSECPAWCTDDHDLTSWEVEAPYTSREAYETARSLFREHRSDFDDTETMTYFLPTLTRNSAQGDPAMIRNGNSAFWDIHLADTDGAEVPTVSVQVQAAGKDGMWDGVGLPLTAAEALLFARQLTAAAEALQFNRPI